jgi:AraC-like DNA-binding protein
MQRLSFPGARLIKVNKYHWIAPDGSDQVENWLSVFAGLFLPGSTDLGESPAFDLWSGKTTAVTVSSCRDAMLRRIPRPLGGRLLDHFGLKIVLDGTMKVGEGAGQKDARAGDGLFIDLTQPLHLEYAGGDGAATALTLWVPRGHASREPTSPATLHGQVFRNDQPAVSVLSTAARALCAELDRISQNEFDQLVSGFFNLAASVLVTAGAPQSTPCELESFGTVCRFIETNLAARDLGAEKLARTFGLSRASLYRLFEPVGGVASYIRASRLNRARLELQAVGLANRRIGPIAYQSGFRSVTAFNRAFREAYGQTPSEVRGDCFDSPSSASNDVNVGVLARTLRDLAI